MNKQELEQLVVEGKSIHDISTIYNKSKTSIRHWLKKYNLTTRGKAGQKPIIITNGFKTCFKCDNSKSIDNFRYRTDRDSLSTYCRVCEAENAKDVYLKNKTFCVNALGGQCVFCNKIYPIPVYDFHHKEPEHKDFNISEYRHTTPTKLINELDKCILVCHNCHMKIHHEMKIRDGYINKIKGNSELWNTNKKRKLDIIGRYSCDDCGYDHWIGNLAIIFDNKKYIRYNRTHFDDDFLEALGSAKIRCRNCVRLNQSV